jgi:deoxyribose-phosphate aldolase
MPEGGSFTKEGKVLCEDCYLTANQRIVACDPWAVRAAKEFEKSSGVSAVDALTDQQRAIYDFIKERGRVLPADICTAFQLTPREVENIRAILRHCELVKGQKDGDKVYVTLF